MQKTKPIILKASYYIFLGLLAYMPLHIFISTVVGTSLGVLDFAKVAKDVVLVVGFVLVLFASLRKEWFKDFFKSRLVLAIAGYGLLTVLLALTRNTDQDAEILGVVYNLRFLVFFLYGWLLSRHYQLKELRNHAVKVVLVSGLIVVLFGIFQYLLLPNNALSSLGFTRENGVLPAFFIDDKPNLERVMSTVRDPNSLGSYLIIIGMLASAGFIAAKQHEKKWWLAYGFAVLLCLYFTFSRSAWIGFLLASAVFGAIALRGRYRPQKKTVIVIAPTILVTSLILVSGLYVARDSYFVQNVIFHADESTAQEDPNELRVRFIQESVQDIADNPLGSGPGTAGLASIRNNTQGVTLNENYYLQIATEVGVVGLLLFLAILGLVGYRLLFVSTDPIVGALIASFVGIAFTNLLVHIWSNEAVAYTWWGLAGLWMYGGIVKNKSRKK